MANSTFYPVQAREPVTTILAGSFRWNGGAPIDNSLNIGDWFTATYLGVGSVGVVSNILFPNVLSVSVFLTLAQPTQAYCFWSNAAGASVQDIFKNPTGSFTINVFNPAGAFIDLASDPGNRVHMTIFAQNSTV